MTTVQPHLAANPLVLSIDVGTSSARALLYDSLGRMVLGTEGRTAYQMATTPDGGVEMVAGDLPGKVCSVAMCTFWHSVMGVDLNGRPVTPLYNWSDTRSREDARELGRRIGTARIHSTTGTMPHSSYYPAKILWLRRTRPDLYRRVERWVSFGEYFYWHLFRRWRCSVSVASGTGLFNPNTCEWARDMLDAVGIDDSRLSPLAGPGQWLAVLAGEYAARWPELSAVPWIPAYGDGASSNIGSGCVTEDLVAINLGTSGAMRICWRADHVNIPPGLWCYRADSRYFVMGGALSNGGDVYAWCQKILRFEPGDLDEQLARMPADGQGLTVLPFYSGERSTGWSDDARGSLVGLTTSTSPIDILRANLEAVAYRFAAIYDLLEQEVPGKKRIVASGGAFSICAAWIQILADVLGVPVIASPAPEASSRGAAISALEAVGYIPDLGAIPAPLGRIHEPDRANYERYVAARHRQQELYDRLLGQRT